MPVGSYRANAEAILRWERSDQVLPGGQTASNASTKQRCCGGGRVHSPVRLPRDGELRCPAGKPRASEEL